MGYTKAAISGFSWQSVLKAGTAVVTLGKIALLARLLNPEQFGQFSLISIALGLSESITQTGINVTILQSKKSVEYYLDTAWVVAICRGLLIGILMVLLGLGMSANYDNEELVYLIALAASIPVIKGFINPAIIQFRKELRFFADSSYFFSLVLVDAALAVILSLLLQSVLALIVAMIGTAVFELLLSFALFKSRPKFSIVPSRLSEILHNSKGLSIAAALTYLNENLDNLIIGKILGTYNLGLYHNGYRLAHKPNAEFAAAANHGLLPVYAKIEHDSERLNRAFKRSALLLIGLVSIATIPLLLAPKLMVQIVLGAEWLNIVPAVPWLAIAGLVQAVTIIVYTLFLAKKRYSIMNMHQFGTLAITVISLIILASTYGLLGASIAICIGRITLLPVLLYGLYSLKKS